MSLLIKDTARQFIAKVLLSHINQQGQDSAENAVDGLLAKMYPENDPMEVCHQLLINEVAAKMEEAERKAAADAETWVKVGQMDLFGSGEFKIPSLLLPKSIATADDFMANKARMETEAADELAKAWQTQDDKANKVRNWACEVHRLYEGVAAAGMNPHEVSIEQAIQQAETLSSRHQAAVDPTTTGQVRTLRP